MSGTSAPIAVAPRPLRCLAARACGLQTQHQQRHSAWCAYLPQRLQQRPELLAQAAAAVPALADAAVPEPEPAAAAAESGGGEDAGAAGAARGGSPSSGGVAGEAFGGSVSSSSLVGQVWTLSQDPKGCRLVQRALDEASSEEERRALAVELRNHVAQAMRCPHANHVLQKCITTMQPESLQFIVDALLQKEGMVAQAAKHRYGCRVLQHLLKVCLPAQVSKIAEGLLEEAATLACHSFGNYAVQHLMKFGSKEHQYRLARLIEQSAASIATSVVGGTVIQTAIAHAAPEDKVWIARAAAADPQVLLALAKARLGHPCALLVLETLSAHDEQRVRAALSEHLEELRASRFGSQFALRLADGC